MKLALNLGLVQWPDPSAVSLVRHADDLGVDSVWVAEAYGSDAVSVLGYLAATTSNIGLGTAIMQVHARTPAAAGMAAATLDSLSGGRTRLGLGVSGPQVVEGWHGVPYGKPLKRTREYVDIVRAVVAREAPLAYEGEYYQVPYTGAGATGLGKSLKSTTTRERSTIPIYLAAIGPRNVELCGEIADGWLPAFFSPTHADVVTEPLRSGLVSSGRDIGAVDIVGSPQVAVGADVAACRERIRPRLALYIGGMGAPGRNFYYSLVCRYGFESAAVRIQELYRSGRKAEAAAAVPDALIDEVALIGPLDAIRERLSAWEQAGVNTLKVELNEDDILDSDLDRTSVLTALAEHLG
ncbi:MAG: LLM class F420-dependent oxidoreductase [Nocardioides sp.]|nr:LLM class F420-dependent oxidoreductase [Nocardioides sp.]